MGLIAWADGNLVDAEAPQIALDDRAFTVADALFETLRVRHGEPGLWAAHLARLREGLRVLDIEIPFSDSDLSEAAQKTLEENRLRDAGLRITVTAGPGPRGLRRGPPLLPRVIVTAAPLGPAPADGRVIVSASTRRNEHSPLARIKTAAAYPDQRLALAEALSAGATDAVLQCTGGALACATTASLILCRGDRALTPRVEDGALPGTVRAVLIERGLIAPARIAADDLAPDDRLLLVNANGVRRVWLSAEPGPPQGREAEILAFLAREIFA